ncbi:MAG: SDR family NAD(P)-dependent oxidoreductase [Magnetovibrionaceae bacterium]
MTVLVTGAAGFIGFHTAKTLLERGETVVGLDILNDYYDVALKQARLDQLKQMGGFSFERADISDPDQIDAVIGRHPDITGLVHLAAQAGVRYSLINPYVYTLTNTHGQLVLLEAVRKLKGFKHFVYASTSSVYGSNTKLPFSIEDRVDSPKSLYAATKKACELISHTYADLYGIPQTGLRFFTVYGPWGRPDMAAYIFTSKILAGQKIPVFNQGDMRRDFTYIDDIVDGVIRVLDKPMTEGPFHRIYNIGNHRTESLMDYIGEIEKALGRKADIELLPMQPGDVKETYADIEATTRDFGFHPSTAITEGIPAFVQWYRDYHKV